MGWFCQSKPAPEPKKPKPEPQLMVPPLFDSPAAARIRMAVPAYELLFGKIPLRTLFDDYFLHHPGNVDTGLRLRPLDHPNVDLTATPDVYGNGGEAVLRWQRDSDDPHTFVEFLASTSNPMLQLRSSAYYPKYGVGAFGTFPLQMASRVCSKDYGVMGLRYGSKNLSIGASFVPFSLPGEVPYGAWFVGRTGSLTAGLQYKPLSGSEHPVPLTDLKNWNCAVSYGLGSTSPLSNSFTLALELLRSKQLVASFYQHTVFETEDFDHYLDLGVELATSVDKDKSTGSADYSSCQIAASWQCWKDFLIKGKLGPAKSSAALALKLPPFFKLSMTADYDHSKGTRSYGIGISADNFTDRSSYETINSRHTVLTQNKVGVDGKRSRVQFEVDMDNLDNLPTALRPIDKVL